jgi:hypothetical protein
VAQLCLIRRVGLALLLAAGREIPVTAGQVESAGNLVWTRQCTRRSTSDDIR